MYRCWQASHVFRWTPILTFTKRRFRFLDWAEENTTPVGFLDQPESIGLSYGDDDVRIVVRRDQLELALIGEDAPISELVPALTGLFDVLDPSDVVMQSSYVQSSVELPSTSDYRTTRAGFGRALVGTDDGYFEVTDGSGLIDFRTESAKGQVEWGVVSAPELRNRLTDPGLGRLRAGDEGRIPESAWNRSDLPAVSVFSDALLLPITRDTLASPGAVIESVRGELETARDLATWLSLRIDRIGDE